MGHSSRHSPPTNGIPAEARSSGSGSGGPPAAPIAATRCGSRRPCRLDGRPRLRIVSSGPPTNSSQSRISDDAESPSKQALTTLRAQSQQAQQRRNLLALGRAPGSGEGYGGNGDNGNNGAYHAHGGPVAESFERLVEWEREELKAHK